MTHADAFDERLEERQQLASQVASRTGVSDRVETALETVPRHAFVPPKRQHNAYIDRPLPIGDGQTISAPHMVAIMADLLECTPGEKVLEIGTGCGYHAAVTAELVGPEHVYSVEYSPDLAANAEDRLEELGYGEISIRTGDGREGMGRPRPVRRSIPDLWSPRLPRSRRRADPSRRTPSRPARITRPNAHPCRKKRRRHPRATSRRGRPVRHDARLIWGQDERTPSRS